MNNLLLKNRYMLKNNPLLNLKSNLLQNLKKKILLKKKKFLLKNLLRKRSDIYLTKYYNK